MTVIKCQLFKAPKFITFKTRKTITGILLYFDSGKGWSTAVISQCQHHSCISILKAHLHIVEV